jgi:hypothetical protein
LRLRTALCWRRLTLLTNGLADDGILVAIYVAVNARLYAFATQRSGVDVVSSLVALRPASGSGALRLLEGTNRIFAKLLTATAATALVATPIAASVAPSSLSVGKAVRASTPTTGTQKAAAGAGGIGAVVLGALIAGGIIFAVVDSNDDNNPDSN